jgi:hypothetical protein
MSSGIVRSYLAPYGKSTRLEFAVSSADSALRPRPWALMDHGSQRPSTFADGEGCFPLICGGSCLVTIGVHKQQLV